MMPQDRLLRLDASPRVDRVRWSNNRRAERDESDNRIDSALVTVDAAQGQYDMRDKRRSAYGSLLDKMRTPPEVTGTGSDGVRHHA